MSSFQLDWDWDAPPRSEMARWVRPLKWASGAIAYERCAAVGVWVTEEQSLALTALEANVMNAEKKAARDVAAQFLDHRAPWDFKWANGAVAATRAYCAEHGMPLDSHAFTASVNAYKKMLQTCRDQRRQFLPVGVRLGHVPAIRLRCGALYDAPIVAGDRPTFWRLPELGEVGLAELVEGIGACVYAEAARGDRRWMLRFVWTKAKGV